MAELLSSHYALVKFFHSASAALSVLAFFTSRALLLHGRQSLYRRPLSRALIHLNDTVLFALGVAMLWHLQIKVLDTPWLQLKLLLVLIYIPLVMAGLSVHRSWKARNLFAVLLVLTVAAIVLLVHLKPSFGL